MSLNVSKVQQPDAASGRPRTNEEFMAALQAFKDHLDANGGLGKNETGEEFVEITEQWDPSGRPLNIPTIDDTVAMPQQSEIEDAEYSGSELSDYEEDDGGFDEDSFEAMMQEMETLDIKAEPTSTSNSIDSRPKIVAERTDAIGKGSSSKETSSRKAPTAGLKRGFLLGDSKSSSSGGIKTGGGGGEASTANDNRSEIVPDGGASSRHTNSSHNRSSSTPSSSTSIRNIPPREAAFTGAVVERQPNEIIRERVIKAPPTASTPSQGLEQPQQQKSQRVSKFKQRMQSTNDY